MDGQRRPHTADDDSKPEQSCVRCVADPLQAVNRYLKSGRREFQYLSDRRRIRFVDLLGPDPSSIAPSDLPSFIHLVCYTWRTKELIGELDEIAEQYPHLRDWRPKLIYEPMPDQWKTDELDAIAPVAHRLYCLSPNHDEAAAFCGVPAAQASEKASIEELTGRLLALGPEVAITRSGALGAFVAREGRGEWVLPAVTEQAKVIDVTGCGNTFLVSISLPWYTGHGELSGPLQGGYMAGLAQGP